MDLILASWPAGLHVGQKDSPDLLMMVTTVEARLDF